MVYNNYTLTIFAVFMPLNFPGKHKVHGRLSFLLGISIFSSVASYTQTSDSLQEIQLTEVRVRAFEQNRKLREVPAAVAYIGRSTIDRYNPASVVLALNTIPGVRMEERSPGSYRFNIRGSSQRSPFGVRNIKVYYNDIPYTDPGGQTYLNQLGTYNFQSLELLKGPGSSLYGAGTGGVLLLNSLNGNERPGALVEYTTGSYNLHNVYGALITGNEKVVSKTSFQHQQSHGYREHSALRRDILSWSGAFQLDSTKLLRTSFLYGDMEYETPGALTLAEYNQNARQARPGNAAFPGAVAARASIQQRTFLAGASYTQALTHSIQGKAVLYGAYTQLRNPAIQNYGRNSEPHVGGRSVFTWTHPIRSGVFTLDAGAEWQQGFASYSIHDNKAGQADTLRMYNEVDNRQSLFFAQATLDLKSWLLTAGLSSNQRQVNFKVFEPRVLPEQTEKYANELMPRLALLKNWNRMAAYTSVSRGFSSPTTEELFPTGGEINLDLNAESGINYDAGARGQFGNFSFDINAFYFSLDNTIVQRRTAGGGSFFTNAGKTDQKGVETQVNYRLFTNSPFVNSSLFWISHTWHQFEYKEFKQVNTDFSGNDLPGTPSHTISSGFDIMARNGLQGSLTYYYNSKMPLNDANSAYTSEFHVFGAKLGYQWRLQEHWQIKLVAGVENLFDEKYSLGNDINGFNGRYYNVAAGRNYYTTLQLQWLK
jgi:iron complex outermembrane receptor protein